MEKNKIKCPFCQSDEIRKIVFGLIKSKKDEKMAKEGFYFVGCGTGDDSLKFHCDNCGKDFGKNANLPANSGKPLTMKK